MDDRSRAPGQPGDTAAQPVDEVAFRDAADIVARASADEAAATSARDQLRHGGIDALVPDTVIGPLLRCGEQVYAVRSSAFVDRRLEPPSPTGVAGDLYLTSRRLLLVGRNMISVDLDEIKEAVISAERLQLLLRDGTGVSFDVDRPRLLRVQIAAARRAARSGR